VETYGYVLARDGLAAPELRLQRKVVVDVAQSFEIMALYTYLRGIRLNIVLRYEITRTGGVVLHAALCAFYSWQIAIYC
jgi:hypothetical protein